jgi:hypothetical protein
MVEEDEINKDVKNKTIRLLFVRSYPFVNILTIKVEKVF